MPPQINKQVYEWLIDVSTNLRNCAQEGSPEYVLFILHKLREDLDSIFIELGRDSDET